VTPQTGSTDEGAAAKPIEAHSAKQWQRALDKEVKVRALLAGGDLSPKARAPVAQVLSMSNRQLRRAIRRFRELDSPAAFLPLKPGAAQGTSQVSLRVESLIRDEITRALKDSPDVAVDDLYPVPRDSAKALGLRPPGRSTVNRRLQQARANTDLLPAKIAGELCYKRRPVRGAIEAEGSLSIVQIDHTVVDVHIVEPNSRRLIGRPVLTLMIDDATRVILGMVLTLEAPSRHTVGLCVFHAVMPEDDWLRRLGIPDACWPALRLMRRVFTDNAQEFHSMSLQRASNQLVRGVRRDRRGPRRNALGQRCRDALLAVGTAGSQETTDRQWPDARRARRGRRAASQPPIDCRQGGLQQSTARRASPGTSGQLALRAQHGFSAGEHDLGAAPDSDAVAVRHLQFQHHDRDDDRDHAVAESFKSRLAHG
jgi:hypothetical protein